MARTRAFEGTVGTYMLPRSRVELLRDCGAAIQSLPRVKMREREKNNRKPDKSRSLCFSSSSTDRQPERAYVGGTSKVCRGRWWRTDLDLPLQPPDYFVRPNLFPSRRKLPADSWRRSAVILNVDTCHTHGCFSYPLICWRNLRPSSDSYSPL